eukprot:224177-Chlamydomonas_euryale.AAC.3
MVRINDACSRAVAATSAACARAAPLSPRPHSSATGRSCSAAASAGRTAPARAAHTCQRGVVMYFLPHRGGDSMVMRRRA